MAEPRTSTPGSPPPRRDGRGWGWIIGLIVLIAVVWIVIEVWDSGEEEIGDAPVAEEVMTDEFGEPALGADEGLGVDDGIGEDGGIGDGVLDEDTGLEDEPGLEGGIGEGADAGAGMEEAPLTE